MHKLQDSEFPSKHLTCYESVLIASLKHQGPIQEALLLGTQAYFVFSPDDFTISPRFNSVDEEWKRVYNYQVQTLLVTDRVDLKNKLVSLLNADVPICLPVDLYSLPHTLHHQQLHQHHYVNIFGYDDDRYYMVCPYYRFKGWVDTELIHSGFFSPVVKARGAHLSYMPKLRLSPLSTQVVSNLVEENCRYMLNLAVPPTMTDVNPSYLGLAGIQTFIRHFQTLISEQDESSDTSSHKTIYINLSRHLMAIGYSRYWFHKLIQSCQPALFTPATADEVQNQFTNAAQAWKAIGMRLGMGVHGQRAAMIQHVVRQLKQIQEQETHLFNSLLGTLPDYEWGTI